MGPKTMVMTFALATGLLVPGVLAQQEQHHSEQPSAPADKDKMMMPGNMPQMMTMQREVNMLSNELLKSFATIENEKDPTVLQRKLAEHGALLKKLQTELEGQSQMMERMRGQMMMMGHMMGGSMMGGEQKKP